MPERAIDVMLTVRLTMLIQTASAARIPSGSLTPRAYRPSPILAWSIVVGWSFQTLVTPVSWMRCMRPSDPFTCRRSWLRPVIRPSAKFGSGCPASGYWAAAANAVSGASEPIAVAATRPVAPRAATRQVAPRAARDSRERRSIAVLISASLSADVDRSGDQTGAQARDRGERGRRQVDDPVGGAGPAAAGPLTTEQVGLRTTVRDRRDHALAVAAVGRGVLEPAGTPGHPGDPTGVRMGDRVASVRGVRPRVPEVPRVARPAGTVSGASTGSPCVPATEP